MFKSEREYLDLDDFFRTSNNNSITGLTAIKKRINELDSLYEEWELGSYNFISDDEENNFIRNEIYESIEIMRDSSLNYIIGEFNASIISSSEAVEKICNAILYLDFIKSCNGPYIPSDKDDWIKVDTVNGPTYYDKKWNKVVKTEKGYIIYKHRTLNSETFNNVERCGYNCSYLSNPVDKKIDKNVFIERRNAAAHGDFSRLPIVEQLHGYVPNGINDLLKLQTNKDAALDQYDKASKFIVNVIGNFNKEYI